MKTIISIILAAGLAGLSNLASAAGDATGTSLAVTGSIGSSLEFVIDWNGGSASTAAVAPLGHPSRSSATPPGWTKGEFTGYWSLTTVFYLKGNIFNSVGSSGYNVAAQLNQAPGQGMSWSLVIAGEQDLLGPNPFSAAQAEPLTTVKRRYASDIPFDTRKRARAELTLDDAAQGSANNIILFTVTAL